MHCILDQTALREHNGFDAAHGAGLRRKAGGSCVAHQFVSQIRVVSRYWDRQEGARGHLYLAKLLRAMGCVMNEHAIQPVRNLQWISPERESSHRHVPLIREW